MGVIPATPSSCLHISKQNVSHPLFFLLAGTQFNSGDAVSMAYILKLELVMSISQTATGTLERSRPDRFRVHGRTGNALSSPSLPIGS